jgi:hypothetical protein
MNLTWGSFIKDAATAKAPKARKTRAKKAPAKSTAKAKKLMV